MSTLETPKQEFIRMLEELPTKVRPWADDVPLNGDGMPTNTGQIEWLIQYLLTIRKRFGNTAVCVERLRWGGSALWAFDEAAKLAKDAETWKREAMAWRALNHKIADIYINGPHEGPARMVAAAEVGKLVAEAKEARAASDALSNLAQQKGAEDGQ